MRYVASVLLVGCLVLVVGCPLVNPAVNLFLEHEDDGGSFSIANGGEILIELPVNVSTGYFWQQVNAEEALPYVLLKEIEYHPATTAKQILGAGGYYSFRFSAERAGTATITMGLFAPGSDPFTDSPAGTYTVQIVVVGDPVGLEVISLAEEDSGEVHHICVGGRIVCEFLQSSAGDTWTVTNEGVPTLSLAKEEVTESDDPIYGGYEFHKFLFDVTWQGTVTLQLQHAVPGNPPLQTFEVTIVAHECGD